MRTRALYFLVAVHLSPSFLALERPMAIAVFCSSPFLTLATYQLAFLELLHSSLPFPVPFPYLGICPPFRPCEGNPIWSSPYCGTCPVNMECQRFYSFGLLQQEDKTHPLIISIIHSSMVDNPVYRTTALPFRLKKNFRPFLTLSENIFREKNVQQLSYLSLRAWDRDERETKVEALPCHSWSPPIRWLTLLRGSKDWMPRGFSLSSRIILIFPMCSPSASFGLILEPSIRRNSLCRQPLPFFIHSMLASSGSV